jgi:RNA polymerase sigma-70 factor (ECF subfamily)
MTTAPHDVTQLLKAWEKGDEAALQDLTPLVEAELHRLARSYLARENSQHTLQPTALINEAWLRLIHWRNATWQNRAHFFGVTAQLMRRVLVDYARRRRYARAHVPRPVSLDAALDFSPERSRDLVALDEALQRLAEHDARKSRIVELRFFGGLGEEEIAEILQVSTKTVQREWNKAKAWLHYELNQTGPDGRPADDARQ